MSRGASPGDWTHHDYLIYEATEDPVPAYTCFFTQQRCIGHVRAEDEVAACKVIAGVTGRIGKYAVVEVTVVEIRTGRLSIAAALEDERSGPLTLLELLTAQHRWGRERVMRLLKAKASAYPAGRLSESKRVRELTDRQRRLIASWCEPS